MAFLEEYTILKQLGKGGFATVYKVRHNELGYIRAIRVLDETILDKNSQNYQKFLRECKILLRLGNGNHPNIVHIYKPDLLDSRALVEMDYVDGVDLFHYLDINQNHISAEVVVRMAIQISSALAYCHEDIYRFCMDRDEDKLQGDPYDGTKLIIDNETRNRLINKYKVIHNDIHSGNIMIREDGNFVLLDFGLSFNGNELIRTSRHTYGASEFKAPEKWDRESILTEQSDIYSFGIVMYQLLAGRVPFPYDTKNSNATEEEFKVMNEHKKSSPPSIEDIRREYFEKKHPGEVYKRDYPQWLEEAILTCLRKNPAERFKNGKELYDFIMAHSQTASALCNDVEIEQLNAENKDLASQLNGLRTTNKSLNDQLNVAQNECSSLSADLRNAKDKIASLVNEIKELKDGKKNPLLIILIVLFCFWGVGASLFAFAERNKVVDNSSATAGVVHDTIYLTKTKTDTKVVRDTITKVMGYTTTNVIHDTIYISGANDARVKQLETQYTQLETLYKQKVKELEEKNRQIAALNKPTQPADNSELLKRKNDTIAALRRERAALSDEISKSHK